MVCNPLNNASQKQKLILAAITSFTICVLLSLYFHHHDCSYLALGVDSIESGNGVYGLNGFYYPPLFGYVLSTLAFLADMFGIPILTVDPIDTAAPAILDRYLFYHPAFPLMFKTLNALAPLAIGYFIYALVKDHTKNEDTAYKMALAWYFCPITIYMIGIQGQFDVLAIMAAIMCVIALRKKSYFIAGALYAISVLLKMFMAPCIIALVLYIWLCERDLKVTMKYTAIAAIGALLVAAITYTPLIMDGTWQYSLTFFSDRVTRAWYMTLATLLGIIPMLCMMALCAIHMIKADSNDADKELLIWVALLFGMAAAISPGYQYGPWIAAMVIIMWSTMEDKRLYKFIFWVASIFAVIQGITLTHVFQLWAGSYYWGFPDYTQIIELTTTLHGPMQIVALITSPVYIILLALSIIITLMDLFGGKNDKIDKMAGWIRTLGGKS